MTDTPKIELRQIVKQFGNKPVLGGIDLSVAKGESLVIIGGSGSGKSVTLKCILGLIRPDAGQILIDGNDTTFAQGAAREEIMSHFGMLFQGGALFDSLRVWENISFRLVQTGKMTREQAHELALEKLAAVGLEARVADLYPAELSGGMQKRVSLARAIAASPDIIFFDEPTTGLDPIMAATINHLIRTITRDMGATAITITHDMASVRAIADRVAMIYEGRIIWTGAIDELDESGNDYVDQFIHGRADGPIKTVKAA